MTDRTEEDLNCLGIWNVARYLYKKGVMRIDYQPKRTWKKIINIIEPRHMAHFR